MDLSRFTTLKSVMVFSAYCWMAGASFAQTDPGPRGGPAGAGGPYLGLNFSEQLAFNQAAESFRK